MATGNRRFYIERLGCAKNDTDAEGISHLLVRAGFEPAPGSNDADIVVVNTCGFIESARDESLQFLQEYARWKRSKKSTARRSALSRRHLHPHNPSPSSFGQVELANRSPILIAAGCFSERCGAELAREMPEIDGIIGTRRWSEIAELLVDILQGRRAMRVGQGTSVLSVPRTADSPSAYVKIADGCNVGCAFCAIPKIKGPQISKPVDEVVTEVHQLARAGVQEVVLIAQNTAAYGQDWGQTDALARLLEKIVESVPDIPWIRLMYTYPEHVTERLIETVARNHQIVKYLDIPLQHAHPEVLRRMRRPVIDPRPLIARLRRDIPGIALRSAFIVGYPGETDDEFKVLLSFLKEIELDRVGIFEYSAEEGTVAASLPGQIGSRVKHRRLDRAMRSLRDISRQKSRSMLGRVMDVLVEGIVEQPQDDEGRLLVPSFLSVGRSYRDAPEVDGMVFLKQKAAVSSLVRARITGASDYDLFGEVI